METIQVRAGCSVAYRCTYETPLILMVEPKPEAHRQVMTSTWTTAPEVELRTGIDALGNTIRRAMLPVGESTIALDMLISVPAAVDDTDTGAVLPPVDALPDDALMYLLPSRFVHSDRLVDVAWELFGSTTPGWERVQAVCDWVHANVTFTMGASTPYTTALDVYEERIGVCRDFAQLAVAFCRALNVPARYVFGYLPDIGVPVLPNPMDFHAWMEVYLNDRWWTFDPRNNQRRIAHIVIGRGRDAADVPWATTFGSASLDNLTVWSDEVV